MERPEEKAEENETPTSDVDWESRILCSDGNCIGVIGPDGKCKECGKPYEGELPSRSSGQGEESSTVTASQPVSESGRQVDSVAGGESEPEVEAAEAMPADAAMDDDWENRILCSDGNCIGVIGPDGKCKECGNPHDPNPESAAES